MNINIFFAKSPLQIFHSLILPAQNSVNTSEINKTIITQCISLVQLVHCKIPAGKILRLNCHVLSSSNYLHTQKSEHTQLVGEKKVQTILSFEYDKQVCNRSKNLKIKILARGCLSCELNISLARILVFIILDTYDI